MTRMTTPPTITQRRYGPYRDEEFGDRTYVFVELSDLGDNRVRVSFTGETYAKHSKHAHSYGQERPSWIPVELAALWRRWHLNDMRAECEHQRELGWTYTDHPAEPCPTCGYRLGTAWLYEHPPENLLELIDAASLDVVYSTPRGRKP